MWLKWRHFVNDRVEKIVEKLMKCRVPVFLIFPQCFPKAQAYQLLMATHFQQVQVSIAKGDLIPPRLF